MFCFPTKTVRKILLKNRAIKPNINDKVALKIAGMVDIVGRVLNEDGNRTISFKTNEVIFGGGRLALKALDIPCEYKNLVDVYANVATVEAPATKVEKEPEYPKEWDEQDDNKVHYWKHISGACYVQAIGQTFEDLGIDAEDCVEISESEYKKSLEVETEKAIETPAAKAETPETPARRTRRVRNA